MRTGFVLGVNPKTLVFPTAHFPVRARDGGPRPADAGAVGHVRCPAILGDTVWALSAAQARAWFAGGCGCSSAAAGSPSGWRLDARVRPGRLTKLREPRSAEAESARGWRLCPWIPRESQD